MKGFVLKSEFARQYNISLRSLSHMLNEKYYDELNKLGYEKNSNLLSPKIVEWMYNKIGKP